MNRAGFPVAARRWLGFGIIAAGCASGALLAGPWLSGLEPASHAYPAIVWTLAGWSALHLGLGQICQAYALCRSWKRKMTPSHDADLWNVTLFWHFIAFGAVLTSLVIGGFPLLL